MYKYLCLGKLILVLHLCRSKEILQNISQVFECGPVLWRFFPTRVHNVVEGIRAFIWLWHPVSSLQVLDDLWVGHAYKTSSNMTTVHHGLQKKK